MSMMLMPSSVDSPSLPIMQASQATTVLTPTSASTLCTVTPTIQPLTQKDTTWTKLFVGGLPYHTTDKSLQEHFAQFGDIEEAVVITDRSTGKSRGYGFVIMGSKESAERACKEPNPIIDGRKANVNLAILGAKPRGNITATSLPLTALRPGFPGLLPSQFGDLSSLAAGGGLAAAYSPAGQHQLAAAAAAAAAASAGGHMTAVPTSLGQLLGPGQAAAAVSAGGGVPGKARSSMSLGLISGRQALGAAPGQAGSPYLYHAPGTTYLQPNILNLAAVGTGNPLLDFYGQYAAAAAAAGLMPAVTQHQQGMMPTSQPIPAGHNPGQTNTMDSNGVAGQYISYAYAPLTAQQLTGLASPAAIPYATAPAGAGPSGAGALAATQPPPQPDNRIQ